MKFLLLFIILLSQVTLATVSAPSTYTGMGGGGAATGANTDITSLAGLTGGLTWATDGAGNIGAAGATRPNHLYVKTDETIGDTSGRDWIKLENSSGKITFGSATEWIGNGGASAIEAHGGGNAFILDGNGFTFYVGDGGFRFNGTTNTITAAAGTLTLLNGPGVSTGDPTKWFKIVIGGTNYAIPCWAY